MEFLGDSILGSVISSYLYERFHSIHKQNEGFLTKLKIRLVCGVNLTQLSKCLKLQKFLIISDQIEKSSQGRQNDNILEDVFEALREPSIYKGPLKGTKGFSPFLLLLGLAWFLFLLIYYG